MKLRSSSSAKKYLNEAQVRLEDGAAGEVLGLAAVPPPVLVHMLVVLAVAYRKQQCLCV